MLDTSWIREDKTWAKERFLHRGITLDIWNKLLDIDDRRLILQREVEQLRHQRRQLSNKISADKTLRDKLTKEIQDLSVLLKTKNDDLREIDSHWTEMMLSLPNLPHKSVPIGASAKQNQVLRQWGEPTKEKKIPHWEIGAQYGWFDSLRAGKVTGSRFLFGVGIGASLERALVQFMMDVHIKKHNYKEISPPFIVHERSLVGTGNFPKFKEEIFGISQTDYFLIPTAEVPVTNFHRESILKEENLPYKYVANTPCFRAEAGAAGRDTKGLIRLHQFTKVELIQIVKPDYSFEALEEVTAHAEEILQLLELPYRVIALCTGDLGFSATKTYDLEVWLPSARDYCEISSCSNCEAFQARRAGIRYKSLEDKKNKFVHTLNGSALAVGRTMAALLECHQRSDGKINIPKALRPYMYDKECLDQDLS